MTSMPTGGTRVHQILYTAIQSRAEMIYCRGWIKRLKDTVRLDLFGNKSYTRDSG